jgi:lysozyme
VTLEEQLVRDEGEVLKMYRCPAGFLTIGVGHNLEAKPISKKASRVILADDIYDTQRELAGAMPWLFDLSLERQDGLINMAFNLGVGGLLQFKKALAAIKDQNWAEAEKHLKDSKWYGQVGKRAERVTKQIVTGVQH